MSFDNFYPYSEFVDIPNLKMLKIRASNIIVTMMGLAIKNPSQKNYIL